ncbi:diguanylate cyclase [bacterium]|nr:diguanylate cyclase [bacterium]
MVKGFFNKRDLRNLVLVVSFILIAIIFVFFLKSYSNLIQRDLFAHFSQDQKLLADFMATRVEEFFADIRRELDISGAKSGIKYLRFPEINEDIIELTNKLENKAKSISRMDTLGVLRCSWPDTQAIGQSIAYQSHVIKTLAEHCDVISQPILTVQGYRAMAVHSAIFGRDSIWLGNICALVPFEAMENRLLVELNRVKSRGFIVDSTGEILYHPDLATGTLVERAFSRDSSTIINAFLEAIPNKFEGFGEFLDHTGIRRPIGISTIELGDYHWYIVVYSASNEMRDIISKINKSGVKTYFFVLSVLFVVFLFIAIFYNKKGQKTSSETEKITSNEEERIIQLFSSGLKALISTESEREVLQTLINNIREVGNFQFVALLKKRDPKAFSICVQSYRKEEHFLEFLRLSNIDPFTVKVFPDPMHPVFQSLNSGNTVKLFSIDQIKTFNRDLAYMGGVLLDILPNPQLSVIPVKVKGELLGAVPCCIEEDSDIDNRILEIFIDQVAQVLQVSEILKQMQNVNELYTDVFHNVDYGIFIVDSDLKLLSYNKIAETELGFRPKLIGSSLSEVFKFISSSDTEESYTSILKSGRLIEMEEVSYDSSHNTTYLRKKIIPVFSTAGGVHRIITIVEDVTAQRSMSEELKDALRKMEKIAMTDVLTGLHNYRYFIEVLPRFIEMSREVSAPLSLIAIDLDDLKRINDNLGHHIGDEVIRNAALLISKRCSPADIVSRYSGDEFFVLLKNTSIENAISKAEVLCTNIADKVMDGISAPEDYMVTSSFGIVQLTDDIMNKDELLSRAESALYRAKAEGKNRVVVWQSYKN